MEIVDFGDLYAQLTAMEAVQCVSDLYTLCDKVIDGHPIYKVETVGQVYMLDGGAPERRPDHAENVAGAALGIRREVETKAARYRGKEVMVRIGMHTGPVAAGVVGRKMLRYCLFGDIVSTTARMQSHGKLTLDSELAPSDKSTMTTTLAQGVWQAQQNLRPAVPPIPIWPSVPNSFPSSKPSLSVSSHSSDELNADRSLNESITQHDQLSIMVLLQKY